MRESRVAGSAEVALLLSCASSAPQSRQAARISEIPPQHIDWDYLVALADWHGLTSFAYSTLVNAASSIAPKEPLESLKAQYCAQVAWNYSQGHELVQVSAHLSRHGILAVPFKGPSLAVSLYGDLAPRSNSDLDLWVSEKDLIPAREALLRRGYSVQTDPGCLRDRWSYCLVKEEGSFAVDLHGKLGEDVRLHAPLEFSEVRHRLKSVNILGAELPRLCNEDLLLLLSYHGAKHGWSRLKWVCDIDRLAQDPAIDWDRVWREAQRLGAISLNSLLLALALAGTLLGSPLPQEALRRIRTDHHIRAVVDKLSRRHYNDEPMGGFVRDSLLLGLQDSLFNRLRVVLLSMKSRVFTPNGRDRSLARLPRRLSFGYSMLRPLRLCQDYGLYPLKDLAGLTAGLFKR